MRNSTQKIKIVFIFIFTLSNLVKNVLSTGNHTYIFQPAPVNFATALHNCNQMNAKVLVIEDALEDSFIKDNYLKNVTNGIWLGMYDFIGNETNVNYYTNKTLSYYNWYKTDPNGITNLCTVYLKAYSTWGDQMCSSSYSVICKVSDRTSTSTPTSSQSIALTTSTSTSSQSIELSTSTSTSTSSQSIALSTSTSTYSKSIALSTATSTSSQSIATTLSGWSEWSPWKICLLVKKRRHLNNSVEIIRSNISCGLICTYDFLLKNFTVWL
jgi:hypothetical protein